MSNRKTILPLAHTMALCILLMPWHPCLATTDEQTIKTITGKTITVKTSNLTTIQDLKKAIKQQENIPQAKQKLTLNGTELDDANTLASYNIPNDTAVHLVEKHTIQINITSDNDAYKHKETTISIDTHDTETIGDIKTKIQAQNGLAPAYQRLHCQNTLLDDAEQIGNTSVKTHPTLDMAWPTYNIVIKNNTQDLTVFVDPLTTVETVIQVVRKKTEYRKKGFHLNLRYKDTQLTYTKPLQDYNIQENATLQLQVYQGFASDDETDDNLPDKPLKPSDPTTKKAFQVVVVLGLLGVIVYVLWQDTQHNDAQANAHRRRRPSNKQRKVRRKDIHVQNRLEDR